MSQWVGAEVQWLIGNDILGTWVVELDWPRGEVRWERVANDNSGTMVPLDLHLGVPLLNVGVAGQTVTAILDSGAHLSYADPEFVAQYTSVGSTQDFYPAYGTFTTDLYRLPVTVAGREFEVQCGVLPPALRRLLPLAGSQWILGVDFFRNRRIVLDYARGRVIDIGP